ncbi:hypothetical protein N7462_003535 [Penicillium macrosclerotiorum]|uniref:uncharacterized protein n=1 Tax=Penicillium macrosclerotiorum TaxID=303699 RepID=UPI002549490B|nr:uncharacterized protein N7462_003535 [Penicillium macrosclerotiorum]KAJ5689143.1 hypothetical protein N7462_003535 [Penicillium macrosclerotiorum]
MPRSAAARTNLAGHLTGGGQPPREGARAWERLALHRWIRDGRIDQLPKGVRYLVEWKEVQPVSGLSE